MDSVCLDPRPLLFFFHLRVVNRNTRDFIILRMDYGFFFFTHLPGMYEEHRFHCTECIFTSQINQKCLFPFFLLLFIIKNVEAILIFCQVHHYPYQAITVFPFVRQYFN